MNKYRAQPVVVDGTRFASKREAQRYSELKLLERAGEIEDLETQPRYDIAINDHKICWYQADFRYTSCLEGQQVVEDVKSPATAKNRVYRLKKKLVEALHDVRIVEV